VLRSARFVVRGGFPPRTRAEDGQRWHVGGPVWDRACGHILCLTGCWPCGTLPADCARTLARRRSGLRRQARPRMEGSGAADGTGVRVGTARRLARGAHGLAGGHAPRRLPLPFPADFPLQESSVWHEFVVPGELRRVAGDPGLCASGWRCHPARETRWEPREGSFPGGCRWNQDGLGGDTPQARVERGVVASPVGPVPARWSRRRDAA